MDFSAAHVHLLLNHFPTIGFIIGFGLLVIGLIAKSDHLKIASLVTIIGIMLVTIPTYVSGSGAQEQICGDLEQAGPCQTDPMVSKTLIDMHEGAAFVSLVLMVFTGVFAWLGLWHYRRIQRLPTLNLILVLLFGMVTLAAVSQAANLGGEIRHPEIRVTQEATEPPIGRRIGSFMATTTWTLASTEAIHFVGLSLIIGVTLLIDLKLLGFLTAIPYATLDRMLPWAILGFGLNAITGMLFFIGSPYQYVGNIAFNWKLGFLMPAGVNMLALTFDPTWVREGQPAPGYSKALAVTALVLWVGVMFWGSMLPFIGMAF